MKILFMVLLLFPVVASAGGLTDLQVKKEVAWQTINLIDYGQTRDIAYKCRNTTYYEHNPILGSCPDAQSVYKYFLVSAISHYMITQYLTSYRDTWQNMTIIVSLGFIQHNYAIGLKINF